MENKRLRCLKKVNTLNSRILTGKQWPFLIYVDFESVLLPEDNGKQNPKVSYTNNIRNVLLTVMAVNQYVLMINLVRL